MPHECPSTQIMLICARKAISPSRRLRIQIGGSRSGLRLRSVTDYGRELPSGGRGRQTAESPVLVGYLAAPAT
jgi:hypothetical protein